MAAPNSNKAEMRDDAVFVAVSRFPNKQLTPTRAGNHIIITPVLLHVFRQPFGKDVFVVFGVGEPKQAVDEVAKTVFLPVFQQVVGQPAAVFV